mgnify:CR=1 FL=1
MTRTQIHLTATEQEGLRALSKRTGQSQSELIRQAIGLYLSAHKASGHRVLLREGRGLWRDRNDLPEFDALRKGFDRPN